MMRLKKLTSIFTALLLIASTIIVPSTFKVNAEYNKTTLLDLDMEVDDVTKIVSTATGYGTVGTNITIASGEGVDNSKALSFELSVNARGVIFNDVVLEANSYYTVTYSYKADTTLTSNDVACFFIGKDSNSHIKIRKKEYKDYIYGAETADALDVSDTYKTKSFTFKATETAIEKGTKFGFVVYKGSGKGYLYLDNVRLEKLPEVTVNINCGGNRDNMVVGGNVGEAITLPTPEEMKLDGYKFEGFYTTSDFQEDTKYEDTTYTSETPVFYTLYARYTSNTIFNYDMETGTRADVATYSGGDAEHYVIDDTVGNNSNKSLAITLGEDYVARTLIFNNAELVVGSRYTLTYDYKFSKAGMALGKANFGLGPKTNYAGTKRTDIDGSYAGIIGTYPTMTANDTDWHSGQTLSFVVQPLASGKEGTNLVFVIYPTADQIGEKLYLDNIKLVKLPDVQLTINCPNGEKTDIILEGDINTAITLPTPEEMKLDGYKFEGFYTTSDFQEESKLSGLTYTQSTAGVYTIYARYTSNIVFNYYMDNINDSSSESIGKNGYGRGYQSDFKIDAQTENPSDKVLSIPVSGSAKLFVFNKQELEKDAIYELTYDYKFSNTYSGKWYAQGFTLTTSKTDARDDTSYFSADNGVVISGDKVVSAASTDRQSGRVTFKANDANKKYLGFIICTNGTPPTDFKIYLDNIKLVKLPVVHLTINCPNGEKSNIELLDDVASPIQLPNESEMYIKGYTFAGFYTDSDFKNAYEGDTYTADSTGSYTLYAKYIQSPDVIFDFNDEADILISENETRAVLVDDSKAKDGKALKLTDFNAGTTVVFPYLLESGQPYKIEISHRTDGVVNRYLALQVCDNGKITNNKQLEGSNTLIFNWSPTSGATEYQQFTTTVFDCINITDGHAQLAIRFKGGSQDTSPGSFYIDYIKVSKITNTFVGASSTEKVDTSGTEYTVNAANESTVSKHLFEADNGEWSGAYITSVTENTTNADAYSGTNSFCFPK